MSPGRGIFFPEAVAEPKESLSGFQQLCPPAMVPRLLWSKGAECCGGFLVPRVRERARSLGASLHLSEGGSGASA